VKALRQLLVLALVLLALTGLWKSVARAARETVVLRTIDVSHQDRFATLWVVDDGGHVWIRAENRERRWLADLRVNPVVELRRRGETQRYRALLFDDPEAIAYVDALFRAKYGLADWLRTAVAPRDSLPIRLERR
jgi:hypothetical protein